MPEKALTFEVVLMGIGALAAWNAILTALDWFNTRYPGLNAPFIFSIMNFLPYIIFQPLTIWKGNNYSYTKRIALCFFIIAALLVVSPLLVAFLPGSGGFIVMCILIVIIGAFNAVAQTSVFGMVGTLPNKYTNAVCVGNGLSGVTLNVIRLICLASFATSESGLLISTIVYFIVAALVLIASGIAQIKAKRHPMVKVALGKTEVAQVESEIVPDEEELDSFGSHYEHIVKEDPNKEYTFKEVFKMIWQYVFLVWLCYVITFGVFPGLSMSTEAEQLIFSGIAYVWFSVLLVTTFNIFDTVGRQMPAFHLLNTKLLWILVFCRFVFWATFVLIAAGAPPEGLFNATWFKFLNMAVFATSNGYASTCIMIYGPMVVPPKVKDQAGYIMAAGLVFGIFSGSLLALSFAGIGTIPED